MTSPTKVETAEACVKAIGKKEEKGGKTIKRMKKTIMLTALVLLFSTSFPNLALNNLASSSYPKATLSIDPPNFTGSKEVQVMDKIKININVANATSLNSFYIVLTYDQYILDYCSATNGSMLNADESKYSFICHAGGKLTLHLPRDLSTELRNDSGTLVTVEFECKATGDGSFTFDPSETKLYNRDNLPIDWVQSQLVYYYKVIDRKTTKYINETFTLKTDVWNFAASDLFIINANNVELDLNGHTINHTHGGGYAITVSERLNNVTIKNGSITNWQYAIKVKERCSQVNILNISTLNMSVTAIWAVRSSHVNITHNTVSRNGNEGLILENCNHSKVSHNTISNSKLGGIDIRDNSVNNTISNNTISDNTPAGINIRSSSQNTIFNNNFINNKDPDNIKHCDTDGSINFWNCSYPYGGNYWDDWNVERSTDQPKIVDEKSGWNSSIPGPDGIGDTPYVIDTNNQDKYPLTNLYYSVLQVYDACTVVDENNKTRTLSVAVFTNSSVADLDFSATLGLISFNVSGNCTSCKVIISKGLLDGAFEIEVDETTVSSSLNWDGGDYDDGCVFVSFNYTSGEHKVFIRGEVVRRCDLNCDGDLNILDLSLMAKEWCYSYCYEKPKPPS